MGIFDYVAPSERAAELSLRVKRLRRRQSLAEVAMVVVEGNTDEPCLGGICVHGSDQVFSAGSRDLVEQLLSLLEAEPVTGCDCVHLVDCDARGKTVRLRHHSGLVVTQNCDLEADLVALGVAERVVRPFVGADQEAREMIERSIGHALPLSVIRRAAAAAGVSMKRRGMQLSLMQLPEATLEMWERQSPDDEAVIRAVQLALGWDETAVVAVRARVAGVARSFEEAALGKDVLDALFRIARREGTGNIRGWTRDHFHQRVRAGLRPDDVGDWVVAQRMRLWAEARGHVLLVEPT